MYQLLECGKGTKSCRVGPIKRKFGTFSEGANASDNILPQQPFFYIVNHLYGGQMCYSVIAFGSCIQFHKLQREWIKSQTLEKCLKPQVILSRIYSVKQWTETTGFNTLPLSITHEFLDWLSLNTQTCH